MTKTPDLPANVRPVADRHGRIRHRFRRKGWPSAYLKGEPGTPEFFRSHADILERGPSEETGATSRQAIVPRSLDDLFRRYKRSARWKNKSTAAQFTQSRVIERFVDRIDRKGRRYGERPVRRVSISWLDLVFADMSETPGAANNLRKYLKGMMDEAIRAEWRSGNPLLLTSRYNTGPGFHDWTNAEIEQYRDRHPLGTMARLTLELALNTAARRCNLNKIERDHIQQDRILVKHGKGNHETLVPVLKTTRSAIEALPAAPIKFLITTAHGRAFSDAGFGNKMRDWCDQAGLPHCSMHGLRKAAARRLAESGATDAEGQAVTGHKKPSTFAYYREKANRTALADRAMSNLEEQTDVQPAQNDENSDT